MSDHNKKERIKSPRVLSEVLQYPKAGDVKVASNYLLERKLDPVYANELGVKAIINESKGTPLFFFPVKKKGKVVGYIQADTSLPKKYRFSTVGEVSEAGEFLGQSDYKPHGKFSVVVTEGVWDWLAVTQAMAEYAKKKNSTFRQPVLSITLGTPSAKAQFSHNADYIGGFRELVLGFDNDRREEGEPVTVIRGQDAAEEVAIQFPTMKNITWEENDANEVLIEHGADAIVSAYFSAKQYEPTSLFHGMLGLEELKRKPEVGFRFNSIPQTDYMIRGMRKGELMVILAPSGVGKTTLTKALTYDVLVNSNEKVGFVFLEEDLQKAQQSYVALHNKVALPRLRDNPDVITAEEWEESHSFFSSKSPWWIKHEGKLDVEKLMNTFKMLHVQGCTTVAFDHFHMVLSAAKNNNMVQLIDNVLAEIAAFTTQTGMKVISVAHIKRTEKPRMTKEEEQEPYFMKVRKEDARGSAAFEQYADIILCLEPEILPSGERGRVRVVVDKNREWGTLGVGDYLKQNEMTGVYHKAGTEDY